MNQFLQQCNAQLSATPHLLSRYRIMYINSFEATQIVYKRAQALESQATPLIELDKNEIVLAEQIARKEFAEGKLQGRIQRGKVDLQLTHDLQIFR